MAHVKEVSRAKGSAYEVKWRDGDRFKQRTFTVRREAERFALKVENEKASGNSTEPLVKNTRTFREVAEAALEADRATRKQKTLDGYEVALRVHIYPTFGARRISTISAEQVQGWLTDLRAKPKANGQPRSETSVLGTYKAVAKVFGYALRHRLISFNPCVAVDKPRADTQEAHFLSPAEVERLARYLDVVEPYGLMVRLTAYTGLRAGELAALRIRDVDLLHNEIRVHLNMTHTSTGYVTDVPKTANSKREVPILVDSLLADLGEYLAGHPYRSNPDAGLWPGKVKGHQVLTFDRPFDPKGFYRYTFKPAARAIGIPDLKLHELRHTFATFVLESGAFDMFELSRLMGHASVGITDRIYAHLRKKDYSTQRARFSAFLVGSTATPARPGQRSASDEQTIFGADARSI